MRPYSMDMRGGIVRQICAGELTQVEIAELWGISLSCLQKLWRRYRELGSVAPDKLGRPPGTGSIPLDQLAAYVAEHQDSTLSEVKAGCGLKESLSGIWNALRRLKLPRKKKVLRASEQDRPDVREKRRQWRRKRRTLSTPNLVFVDQTSVTTNMARTHGRAPVGERVIDHVPDKQYQTSTLMGALHWDGTVESLVYPGATDTAAMQAFIDSELSAVLKPGDIVVWDNLKPHRSPMVVQAIEQTGARVCPLPPYSPDMNPIEELWSKLKTLLRGIAARTQVALLEGLDRVLKQVTILDVHHWFEHCGYT